MICLVTLEKRHPFYKVKRVQGASAFTLPRASGRRCNCRSCVTYLRLAGQCIASLVSHFPPTARIVPPDALSRAADWPTFVTALPSSQNAAHAPECDISILTGALVHVP